ncbi:glycosyltransferase [Leptolyngbya sp. FACHB-261]|uniref:glycosyltransferase family 2 protein n=1 Tax=Leptolyngbya sp. FACHB-261 TaxID=2692806 RepID=UPI0018EFBF83|nr:glycosyltransferase [Leptolyngbya sp. FACHB-261]
MPVYNGERYLREALDAILAQTFQDFELVISDNASTDSTEAICREYTEKDQRIKYYRSEQNLGAAWNFNRSFELSSGEYFKWVAYDDICAPEYLDLCVEVLRREPSVVLCYPRAHTIDENGKYQGVYTENLNIRSDKPHERFYQLLETYGWYHATQAFGLIRTSALKETLLLGNYPHADRVLLAELALRGEFFEVPEYLFLRRVHKQNSQRANVTDTALANWFDPKNKGKIVLPRWRRYFEYCRAIQRTELNFLEQMRCYKQVLQRLLISPGVLTRLGGMVGDLSRAISLLPRLSFGRQ